MHNTQPYNIGFVSIFPFEIIHEYGPPEFQRGLLHLYYKNLLLHVLICHLNAHNSDLRSQETIKISEIILKLNNNNEKVILMGDFNTLSPFDKQLHIESNLNVLFNRTDNHVSLIF